MLTLEFIQRAIAAENDEAGASKVLALKANQRQVLELISSHFPSNPGEPPPQFC